MAVLNEENCGDKINSFTYQDWRPLLELIPKIENTTSIGEYLKPNDDEDGVIQIPYCSPAPIVFDFSDIVYDMPIIIDFNWCKWDEGRKIVSDENFDFDTVSLLTKCKLITAIVRNNRFCDGVLGAAFKSGQMLKILKSIEKEVRGISNHLPLI
jgi:hypothetical protein